MKTWRLQRTVQCAKCPWRVESDPRSIPNGCSEAKHRALKSTIAEGLSSIRQVNVMACHETHDAHCVGWLVNQMGPGNNFGLRIRMLSCENASEIKLRGEQHATFADTPP